MNVTAALLVLACLLVLAANLAVLGVTVKLYTEILKDRKFDVREARSGHDGGRKLSSSTELEAPAT